MQAPAAVREGESGSGKGAICGNLRSATRPDVLDKGTIMNRWKDGPAVAAAVALYTLLAAAPADAYVGPGAGLGMIGSLIAVIAVVLIMVFGLIVYPVRLLRKRRQKKGDE